MVRHTLDKMARGGIYDHLGGGFARYSTDERWLVPHFEKMLYDNALLATVYLEAYQVTARPGIRPRRPRDDGLRPRPDDRPRGGLLLDRGRRQRGRGGEVLRLDARRGRTRSSGPSGPRTFAYVYDVTEAGQLGRHRTSSTCPSRSRRRPSCSAATRPSSRAELDEDRARLLAARDRRVPPGKDTKVLTSWNGLMIAPLAEGGRILKDERYLDAARAGRRLPARPDADGDGRLLHTYKDGQAKFNAYLDDYANLIDGLTRLFEVDRRAALDRRRRWTWPGS